MNTVDRLKEMDKRLYAMWRGADEVGAPIAASLKDLAEDIRSLIADLEREEVLAEGSGPVNEYRVQDILDILFDPGMEGQPHYPTVHVTITRRVP
jgi:hypothetical protein